MFSSLHKHVRPIAFLVILLIIAFYDIVFLNKTFKVTTANSQALPTGAYGQEHNKPKFIPVFGTDSPVQEEPVYEFIRRNLRQGILPLWNPHQGCGYPLLAMIEVGMFYPLNAILYLLPDKYSWDLLILLRILLAGILTYGFMRSLRFKQIPSLVSGISFMLSGPLVLIQFWTMNVDILLPLLLLACNRLCEKPDRKNLVFLTGVIFLTILGGHPEHILLINGIGTLFLIYRIAAQYLQDPQNKKHARVLILYPLAYILAGGLAAFAWFPFIRNLIFEFWHGHPQGTGLLMEDTAGRAITLALPHFFQSVPLTYQWEFAGWLGGYLGTLPMALAFLSLFRNQKRGLNYFFAILATLIISKEYGLPFINWIGYLPVLKLIRYSYHTPPMAAFAVAVLAGMGARAALSDRNVFRKTFVFTLGLSICIALNLIHAYQTSYFPLAVKATNFSLCLLLILQTILWLKDRGVLKPSLIGLLLVAGIFTELFLYIHREHPRRFESFPRVPYIDKLKSSPDRVRSYGNFWAFYPSTGTGFGVDDLGYFFGLVPKRFAHFTNNMLLRHTFKDNLSPPALRVLPIQGREHILDLLNIRYLVLPQDRMFERPFLFYKDITGRLPLVYSKEVRVFERPSAFPRVFIVHRALFETRQPIIFALMEKLGRGLLHVAVVQAPDNQSVAALLKTTPLIDGSSARIRDYTPNVVIVEAEMENHGILVFSDAYHPDWNVSVNGKKWKLLQVDYLLRGVFLPKGKYLIKFSFEPRSFAVGLWVSFISLFILIAIGQRKRHRP